MRKILISTSSFGVESKEPLQLLEAAGIEYTINPHGRKLSKDETVSLLQNMDGVVAGTESYPKEIIEKLPSLKIISRCGAGMDGIDQDFLKKSGIALVNTPDVHVTAVAELALSGLLSVNRKLFANHTQVVSGSWSKVMGRNLSGKTIGLIGMGKVGQAFAHLLSGFGCHLLAYDPYYKGSWPAGIQRVTNLNAMWGKADVISLHIPATDETRHILNRQVFQSVKHDVIIINTSRGDLIDERALFEFLQGHPEAGAYLDVFQQEPYTGPLTSLANIVVTPHIGTFTRETRVNMEIESVMNLINFFRNHE